MPARITSAWLVKRKAGADQVELFRRTFPRGAPVTVATLHKARAAGLHVCWLVGHLPAPARRAYAEVEAPAWRAYTEARAPAWRAYTEARAPARRAYAEATAAALCAGLRADRRK